MAEVAGEYMLPLIVMAGVIVLASIILVATRMKKITLIRERPASTPEDSLEASGTGETPPTAARRATRSVPSTQVTQAKEELRSLSLEKEIVGFALTRLYEAEADGKITKEDQSKLLDKYSAEMKQLDKQIRSKELIVKLYDLESTQGELIQLFNTRLDEINQEIRTIRGSLGLEALDETPPKDTKPATPAPAKEEREKPPPKRAPPKTEAEQKLEAIQDEVLKVLERLDRIETEA